MLQVGRLWMGSQSLTVHCYGLLLGLGVRFLLGQSSPRAREAQCSDGCCSMKLGSLTRQRGTSSWSFFVRRLCMKVCSGLLEFGMLNCHSCMDSSILSLQMDGLDLTGSQIPEVFSNCYTLYYMLKIRKNCHLPTKCPFCSINLDVFLLKLRIFLLITIL